MTAKEQLTQFLEENPQHFDKFLAFAIDTIRENHPEALKEIQDAVSEYYEKTGDKAK